jgi:hypothetical protein
MSRHVLASRHRIFSNRRGARKLRFNIMGTGGLLAQPIAVPIESASKALARAVVTQEEFLCAVVVTDENGMPVSMAELEDLAKME